MLSGPKFFCSDITWYSRRSTMFSTCSEILDFFADRLPAVIHVNDSSLESIVSLCLLHNSRWSPIIMKSPLLAWCACQSLMVGIISDGCFIPECIQFRRPSESILAERKLRANHKKAGHRRPAFCWPQLHFPV